MHETLFVIEVKNERTGVWTPATRHRNRQDAVELLRQIHVSSPTRIVEEKVDAS